MKNYNVVIAQMEMVDFSDWEDHETSIYGVYPCTIKKTCERIESDLKAKGFQYELKERVENGKKVVIINYDDTEERKMCTITIQKYRVQQ